MSQEDDKGFFDRLGEILNAPLPGMQTPQAPQKPGRTDRQWQGSFQVRRVRRLGCARRDRAVAKDL